LLVNGEKEPRPVPAPGKPEMPTILVVDDEDLILELVCDILKRQGYIVLAASRPSRAIEIAVEHDGIIDLLITDIIMPEMNGQEVAIKISQIRPATKVLSVVPALAGIRV
jgi:CheY-like chemotaxis protein